MIMVITCVLNMVKICRLDNKISGMLKYRVVMVVVMVVSGHFIVLF